MTKMNRIPVKARNAKLSAAIACALFGAALLSSASVFAQEPDYEQTERERLAAEDRRLRREEAMISIELRREEAELAAESARMRAEELRAETERLREEAQSSRETLREEQVREYARVREELSRTHQELRRASQEVARAHRDLALAENRNLSSRAINLGDRAMLGVVLGGPTNDGIRVVGLSPDGPAERAGIQTGDILTSIRGESLSPDEDLPSPQHVVFQVMSDLGEGEEVLVEALREDKRIEFMVKPEKREPASWASYIRLPAAPSAPTAPSNPVNAVSETAPAAPNAPSSPDAPEVLLETIEVPPVDTAALVAEAELLAEEFEQIRMVVADGLAPLGYAFEYEFGEMDFAFDERAFSEIGAQALNEASVWFGTPATMGVRFVELNEGLGAYFGAERGVLVLDAPGDNPLNLKAGDVILSIGKEDVSATSDVVRALRDYQAGDTVTLTIRRHQRDESLSGTMPDSRFGVISREFIQGDTEVEILPEVAVD